LSEVLKKSEDLCIEVADRMRSLPYSTKLGDGDAGELDMRLEKAKSRLSRARNKIVMRTPRGKELAEEASNQLLQIQKSTENLEQGLDPQSIQGLLESEIKIFEGVLDKIETYYKSFEAELT